MRKFLLFLLLGLGSYCLASPYYAFFELNSGMPMGLTPKSLQTDPVVGESTSPASGTPHVYEAYKMKTVVGTGYALGGGYKLKPLFSLPGLVNNAIEVSIEQNEAKLKGTRTEYEKVPPATPDYTPAGSASVRIKFKQLKIMSDYVLNFATSIPNLSWFTKVGFGLDSYHFTGGDGEASDTQLTVSNEHYSHNGTSILYGLGLGVNYQLQQHYSIGLAYHLQGWLSAPETGHPTWATPGADNPEEEKLKAAADHVKFGLPDTLQQIVLRLAYQF